MSGSRFETPDIAALDGETPDLLPVLISRESVGAMAYEPLLGRLRGLSAELETVLRMRGRVVLTVHGYDDDPRPLSVIPEFQRFAVGMLERWPEMAWYPLLLDDLPDGLTAESPDSWRPHADGAALPWLLGIPAPQWRPDKWPWSPCSMPDSTTCSIAAGRWRWMEWPLSPAATNCPSRWSRRAVPRCGASSRGSDGDEFAGHDRGSARRRGGLADDAARFDHWLGQRVQIGTIPRVGSPPFATRSGRCGRVVATHFAGVYIALDPAPRERTHKQVLVLLERSGVVDDSVLTPLTEQSPGEMPCMYIGAVE